MEKIASFRKQMNDYGLDPGEIVADSSIHRYPTRGDKIGECSGAYWHNGNVGWFMDWRTMSKPIVVKGKLSAVDQEALSGSFTGFNNKVSREALDAGIRKIWNAGTEPNGHPYLERKCISLPVGRIKEHEGRLIIPMFGINGELNGLQRINANGKKRFLVGTRKKGSFFSIPGKGTYIICEGFSTGTSLYMATGDSIIVAFDAGNLLHVAREILKKVCPQNIIIAGDNDIANARNIGAEMAKKAGAEISARIVLPEFKRPDGKKTTDFNDLHIIEGIKVVRQQIERGRNGEPNVRSNKIRISIRRS